MPRKASQPEGSDPPPQSQPKEASRTTIELQDLRDRIRNYRDDPMWREASLGAQCRALIMECLEKAEVERQKQNAAQNEFADRAKAFILAMATNGSVDGLALARLASDLGISTEQLHQLLKAKGGKIKNGA